MRFIKEIAVIVRKDILSELRSGEIFLSMLLFSLLMVLVFSFSFIRFGYSSTDAASGIIWVCLCFTGVLGISRVWDRERDAQGLWAMLLSPASCTSIFWAKTAVIFFLLAIVSLITIPLVIFLFEIRLPDLILHLALLLGLGILGFSMLGTFFGAIMATNKSRDLLFAIILFPLLFPLLIAGVMGTSEIFSSETDKVRLQLFSSLLVAFDAIVGVLCVWTFESLVKD